MGSQGRLALGTIGVRVQDARSERVRVGDWEGGGGGAIVRLGAGRAQSRPASFLAPYAATSDGTASRQHNATAVTSSA